MVTGGQCVMIDGQPLMPMWPADSLDTLAQVSERVAMCILLYA